MDFAVIETGGKQYIVKPGDTIKVERLKNKDAVHYFDKVLLISNGKELKVGKPYIESAKVSAETEKEIRGKKITILRYHSKTRHRRKKGHRQIYTQVKIKAAQ